MRAKFRCCTVSDNDNNISRPNGGSPPNDKPGKGSESVSLTAVCSDTGENKDFNDASPSGSLSIWINNPSAWGFFKAGLEYYLDFTEAPAPVAVTPPG